MLKFKALASASAVVILLVSAGMSFAQYKGPPIIVQTPAPLPNTLTQPNLNPLPLTGTITPVPAPTPATPIAPAPANPARP